MSVVEHHYTECGLMNVFISGIEVQTDDDGDEVIIVPAVNELHHVIATGIVNHPKGISGDELRFLRTEMGLTQSELSGLVHRDKQSIGRWERGEVEIDSPSETLIRRLAIESLACRKWRLRNCPSAAFLLRKRRQSRSVKSRTTMSLTNSLLRNVPL